MHKRGIPRFSVANLLSHSGKKLRKGTFLCFRKILVSKYFMHKKGRGITVLCRFFLSHSTETFRRGTLLCFRKFRASKDFMDTKGLSRFSVGNVLSHSTENFFRGTLLCFKKFRISKNVMDKKGGREGGREY